MERGRCDGGFCVENKDGSSGPTNGRDWGIEINEKEVKKTSVSTGSSSTDFLSGWKRGRLVTINEIYCRMNQIFSGETVIISGGLGDIGRSIAFEFAKQGANIAIGDLHTPSEAGNFLSELEAWKVRSHYRQVDVADAAAVKKWVTEAEQELALPTIIIANAAIVTPAKLHEISADQWNRELRVNLDGAFHLTQFATSRLIHHHRTGKVVFVGSWAAHSVHTHIRLTVFPRRG